MASGSLLEKVAQHETALLADLATAGDDAQRIIDAAHAKASAHLLEIQAKMDAEITEMRRKAAKERVETRESIENSTEQQVKAIREQSADRLVGVRAELLNMILPNKGGAA